MPELPEVETVRRTLLPLLLNKRINDIEILYPKMILESDLDFVNTLKNRTFSDIKRKGKYLLFILDNEYVLISHLRMEGKYILLDANEEKTKHSRVIFHLDNGINIAYDDTRCFGIMKLIRLTDLVNEEMISKLGPEPTNFKDEDIALLKNKLQKSHNPIKVAIMDQSNIAGLGNIYADEVLFATKINPLTPASEITLSQLKDIVNAAIKVLNKAITLGGSTVKSYHAARGVDGKFQNELLAYGKKDSLCPNCGYPFKKIFVGGRGTTYCPRCQKLKFNCKIVAIIGKVASGKSTALKYFSDLGYQAISADDIVSKLYERADVIKKISHYFKSACLNNAIDRHILKELIKEPKKKAKLESLIHPLVEEELINRLSNLTGLVFIEVPLLFEAHLDYLADYIIAIDADEETIKTHLALRHVKDIEEYLKLNENVNFANYKDKINYFVKPHNDIKVFHQELERVLNKIK